MRTKKTVFKRGDILILPNGAGFGVAVNKQEAVIAKRVFEEELPRLSRGKIPSEVRLCTSHNPVVISHTMLAVVNAARLAILGKPWY